MIFFKDSEHHDRIVTKVNRFLNTACDIVHLSVHTGIPTHLLLAVKRQSSSHISLSNAHILLIYLYHSMPANYVSHRQQGKLANKFLSRLDPVFLRTDGTLDYQAVIHDLTTHQPYTAVQLFSQDSLHQLSTALDSNQQRQMLGYANCILLEQYAHFATQGVFYSKPVSYLARHLPIIVMPDLRICQHLHDELISLAKQLKQKDAKVVVSEFRQISPIMPSEDLLKIYQDVHSLVNTPKKRYYFALSYYLLDKGLHPHYLKIDRGVLPTDRTAEKFISKLNLSEKYACLGVHTNTDKAVPLLNEFLALSFNIHPLYRLIERDSSWQF